MLLNDGSQYRVVTDPEAHMATREVFAFRVASAKGGTAPYVDTAFARHRDQLAGMRGLVMYQFAYANLSPESQAEFFLQALGGGLRWNEMIMIDPEVGGGFRNDQRSADWVAHWLAIVEPALDARAWIYIPRALSPALQPLVGGRVVMAPRYSGTDRRGTSPDWPHDVHQFTDRGPFPGCSQSGDLSYSNLTADDMLARSNPSGMGASPAH